MATLKITQVKSRIGATAQQRKNLDALGLRKIGRSVEHSDSAIIKGMVEKVKHLVKIEVIESEAKAEKAPKAEAVKAVEAEVKVEETAEKPKKTTAKKAAAPKEEKPAAATKKTSKTTKKEE